MSKSNQRKAYGNAIVELGKINKDVVALDADLSKSTMSCMFQEAYPDRFFEMGIAEQDMLSTAAGLAAGGKIPFASTFAVFVTGRAYDQIRQTISIGKLNVKICGSSAGFSDFGDGSTHQSIDDLAIMNAIPNMTILTPADANETRAAVMAAAEIEGPVYIRVSRNDVLDVTPADEKLEVGKMRVLKDGKDVVIFAFGTMIERALDAAGELEKDGVSVKVVNVSTMKPFNYDAVVELSKGAKAVIAAEEANFIGGLSGAVATALRKSAIPMDYVAVNDVFGQSAHDVNQLMEHYGLTSANIVKKAKELL